MTDGLPHVRQRAADGRTLSETVHDRLRADIIAGRRPAGERLRIEWLSRTYGVGQTPLREALQRLCAAGLVTAQGNRGFTVAPLDIAEFRDLNIARTAIETEALRLAIARGGDDWEAAVVAALYRLEKQDAALARDETAALDAWEAANAAFHDATVAACGSHWLLRLRAMLSDQCERYRRASVGLRRADRDLAAEHRAIAEAVLARDGDAACARITAHFATTTDLLSEEMTSGVGG